MCCVSDDGSAELEENTQTLHPGQEQDVKE